MRKFTLVFLSYHLVTSLCQIIRIYCGNRRLRRHKYSTKKKTALAKKSLHIPPKIDLYISTTTNIKRSRCAGNRALVHCQKKWTRPEATNALGPSYSAYRLRRSATRRTFLSKPRPWALNRWTCRELVYGTLMHPQSQEPRSWTTISSTIGSLRSSWTKIGRRELEQFI